MSQNEDVQTEWVLFDVLKMLFETKNKEKLFTRWNDLLPHVRDLHHRVWSEKEFPEERIPKKARKKVSGKELNLQDLLDERTIATTVLISALVVFAFHNKRTLDARRTASDLLWNVCRQVCKCSDSEGMTGDQGLKANNDGSVDSSSLWTELDADTKRKVVELWEGDMMSSKSLWVQSNHERPRLADVIGFAFRKISGKKSENQVWDKMKDSVQASAHEAIRLVAYGLHKMAAKLTLSQGVKRKAFGEAAEVAGTAKKKRKRIQEIRMSGAELTSHIASVVEKLYGNEVAR